ncbi:MAG: LamG domain-containing protein [Phycisphaerae bacterium]|nr:LamG domain-containing protein [Phycisphaerae bacterium]
MCRKLIFMASIALVVGLMMAGTARADLVGQWKFDEGSGTTAYDSSGNGHDGTLLGGAAWTPDGRFGGGLELDGTSGYVSIPSFELTTDTITFVAWVNGWKAGDWAPLISSRVVDQCEMIFSNDDTLRYVWNNDSSDTWGWTGGPVIPQDMWTMLAVTIDPAGATAYVYTDDDGLTQTTNAIAHVEQTVGALQIGYSYDPRYVRGIMDEVAVYDHVLSEDDIMNLAKGAKGLPLARGPSPVDGAMLEATWVTLGWRPGDFALLHDVYLGDNFDDVNNGTGDTFRGNQSSTMLIAGFAGFAFPEGLAPGTTYYWRIDEVNDADPNSPWKGDIWTFSVPPKTAYNPDPADGAEFVDPNAVFTWTPGFGAKLHTAYMGTSFDDVNNAAGGIPLGSASYSPGTLESEKVYYWRVDEFDPPFTHKGDVWSFTTPGAVGNPQPANGAAGVQMIETLSWTAADNATSHELYFGTDAEAVKNATTASAEYIGPRALGAESYDPGGLTWDSSYAWRLDEVYPTGTVKGLVWTFTTADFILVDDFESYNDIDPPDAASNRIFDKWIDGFGTTTNGALVGNDMPPYAETTVVHAGGQSMIYRYDNNLKTSEATLTLVYPRDWTEQGVGVLSLWIRGDTSNAAERIYVALNGVAVYHGDPAAAQAAGWTEWPIPLSEFAGKGVNLAAVNTISIGLGDKNNVTAGGSGVLYVDDIRLYRPAP